jgi:hypothetical protein
MLYLIIFLVLNDNGVLISLILDTFSWLIVFNSFLTSGGFIVESRVKHHNLV